MAFYLNLKRIRNLRGITQSELAARTGIASSRIANLESARFQSEPSIATLRKLAASLECSILDLVDDVPRTPIERPDHSAEINKILELFEQHPQAIKPCLQQLEILDNNESLANDIGQIIIIIKSMDVKKRRGLLALLGG